MNTDELAQFLVNGGAWRLALEQREEFQRETERQERERAERARRKQTGSLPPGGGARKLGEPLARQPRARPAPPTRRP